MLEKRRKSKNVKKSNNEASRLIPSSILPGISLTSFRILECIGSSNNNADWLVYPSIRFLKVTEGPLLTGQSQPLRLEWPPCPELLRPLLNSSANLFDDNQERNNSTNRPCIPKEREKEDGLVSHIDEIYL